MRTSLNRALWVLALVSVHSYAQDGSADSALKRAVIAAEAEVVRAIQVRDEPTLRKRFAQDFIFIHPSSGAREPLAPFISRVLNGQASWAAGPMEKYDIEVKLIGENGAVLTETVNIQNGGRSRWSTATSVWRKSGDVWRKVHHHSSSIGDGIVETPEVLANYNRIAGEYRRSDGGRWTAGRSLELSIRKDGKRLLMFGLFGQRARQDPLIPQGGLEFHVSRFRVKVSLDETGTAASLTATEDGKVSWVATRVTPFQSKAEIVSFPSGDLTLRGVLYKPAGPGPFPAVLFNHGSAKDYTRELETLGPVFADRGWVFFAPYRRGQGLSASAGAYIGDQMNEAQKVQGRAGRFETMVRLLRTDHLNDQMAALAWLKESGFVHPRRIAVAGNSFGGIQTLLGAESGSYCAAIASAAAAQTWSAPVVQSLMTKAVGNAQAPIFFFQAENDWDLTPSRSLAATAESAGKRYRVKIYPPFGSTKEEGHSFGYFGSSFWADDVLQFMNEHCRK